MTMREDGPSLQTDRVGQASTIGVILILAITLMGTGLVVGYGMQAIGDTERVTTLSKAEHSMTQFDSQAAIVALGESAVQRVDLGSAAGGRFSADDDGGWIRIVHRNVSGNGTNEELYNASLGVVQYENDDTTVAYQGGGVWRRSGNGSTMLSPPEFNYRGGTLTLPVIRVSNEDSAAGEATAILKRANNSRRVYPNQSTTYSTSSRGYSNPITSGTVTVTVKSEFYKGWGSFFNSRTAGNVSIDHGNGTATVELLTLDKVGDFTLADIVDTDGVSATGQSPGHSLTEFSMTAESDQGNGFNHHYISFYAEEDNHRFQYLVHIPPGTNCNTGVTSSDTLEAAVLYRNTATGEQHEWSNKSIRADSGPIRLECPGGGGGGGGGPPGMGGGGGPPSMGAELHIDVTSSQPFTYGDISVDGTDYDWSGTPVSTANFNHTEDGEPSTFQPTNTTTSQHLARHYVALLGDDFTLYGLAGTGNNANGGGAQINYGESIGTLDYDTAGETYITYLHVTENDLEVELES
ncbi:MAG: hypothetical protein V5A38_00575 [Halolamina sp.]